MTDIATGTPAELEARIAELERRLNVEPAALTPPITIGELTDVPAPGSQLAAAWAQEVSSRIVQRFANKAALVAWAAPPGSFAVDLATGFLWRRFGGVWSMFTPVTMSQGGNANGSLGGVAVANSFNLPADPAPRICNLSCFLVVDVFHANQCFVSLNFNGVAVAQADIPITITLDPNAVNLMRWNIPLTAYNNIIPANTTPNVSVTVTPDNPQSPSIVTIYGEYFRNRMDVTILPKGY